MSLEEYLGLTKDFSKEKDKNIWAILIDSFHSMNRIVASSDRPTLEAFVQRRMKPLAEELGWASQQNENQHIRQLRGELLRALGTIGNDPSTQAQAIDLFTTYSEQPTGVDPNILPALVSIMAFTGTDPCYQNFCARMAQASTPQEERRYLYALAGFREQALLDHTLEKTMNGDIRTQDAPFVVSSVLMNVYGRDLAWKFVKKNWDAMDQLFPKQGLRRMCGGIVGLVSPEYEQDVRTFFETKHIDLGGKTLAQYQEQLRIAVTFQKRNAPTLKHHLKQHL